MSITKTKAFLNKTNSPDYIRKVITKLPYIEIKVEGSNLYTETNVDYAVNLTNEEYISAAHNGTVKHLPKIELEVEGTDGSTYTLVLDDCRLKISEYGNYGCLYAKNKYLQRLGVVKAREDVELLYQTDSVEALKTDSQHIKEIKNLRSYIYADTWAWDFEYVESLIDKMSDEELDCFIGTGKSLFVENVERSDIMPAYY